MKLYVIIEEFLYAKKIENQTERTLRGYKNPPFFISIKWIFSFCALKVYL